MKQNNEEWLYSGYISPDILEELWTDFQTSDDKNKEHYRWRAFTKFIKTKKVINEKSLRELYRLGETDADHFGMGMAMRIDILQRRECPTDLVEKALNSNDEPLVKVAKRKLGLEYKK